MNIEKYSKPILRISLSLVFLWFGFQQITSPESWDSFVPGFLISMGIAAKTLVTGNAILELTLGLFLLFGIRVRLSALILSLHLFGIAFFMGIDPTGVRDFGLATATFAIFLNGADQYCLDKKFSKTSQ
ncbi:DoxX family membrane protein [Candidatus Pacearchaeota archaeon]|nr:DoxX family membrane protein [Candidatus Pacearchaeota archaeon]